MAHLFDKMMSKSRSKTSYEAVTKLTGALEKLNESSPEKLQEEIAKNLTIVKARDLPHQLKLSIGKIFSQKEADQKVWPL